jgi:transcriptional regulator with XRE-family HTH domain
MAAGRRGRPYQVPFDETPIGGPTVDVDSRVGWLLLMSRLHHPDPELALGESFNAALRRVGLQADRSAVSRWESGKVTPRYSVLVAYEQALGLRGGQLTSVVNAQRRAFGGPGLQAWMPILDSSSDGFHERLDGLFDSLLEGPATGPEWTSLAHHVAAAGTMYVHGRVWEQLAGRLIDQMARSVGVAYLQRFETMRLLLEHRVAHPWLLRATAEFLDDPAVQIVNDPMGVLEISNAPEAAELVLDRFLSTTSPDVLGAASDAVAIKVEQGYYSGEQLGSIELAMSTRLQQPDADTALFEELIVTMPDPARSRLVRATRGLYGGDQLAHSAIHGERFTPETTRKVSESIAGELRGRFPSSGLYDDDRMTPRLIREALFSSRIGRAHYASLALLGSPFRAELADVLAGEIESVGLEDPLTPRFARLMRYLSGPRQEESLLAWLPKAPPPVARDFALTIGHLLSDRPLRGLLPLITGDRTLLNRALIYGLGMRQATALHELAADDQRARHVRAAAEWWKRHGGAVRV